MARVRWHGSEYVMEPLRQFDNGDWLMRAKSHGPRFVPGTEVRVTPAEIIEMAADEAPASNGQAELEAALAKERAAIPSVESILKPIQDAAKVERAKEADALVGESVVRPT